jgi:hypothetical protein
MLSAVIACMKPARRAGSAYSAPKKSSPPFASFCCFPVLERLGQRVPEPVEPRVCHLQDPADVGRLLPVEEQLGIVCIRVHAVIATVQEPECHERIKEVERAALMQPKPSA